MALEITMEQWYEMVINHSSVTSYADAIKQIKKQKNQTEEKQNKNIEGLGKYFKEKYIYINIIPPQDRNDPTAWKERINELPDSEKIILNEIINQIDFSSIHTKEGMIKIGKTLKDLEIDGKKFPENWISDQYIGDIMGIMVYYILENADQYPEQSAQLTSKIEKDNKLIEETAQKQEEEKRAVQEERSKLEEATKGLNQFSTNGTKEGQIMKAKLEASIAKINGIERTSREKQKNEAQANAKRQNQEDENTQITNKTILSKINGEDRTILAFLFTGQEEYNTYSKTGVVFKFLGKLNGSDKHH